jgi:hypothetical protein
MPAEKVVRRWRAGAGRAGLGTARPDIDRWVRSPALPLRPSLLQSILDPLADDRLGPLIREGPAHLGEDHLDGTSRRRIVPVAPGLHVVPPGPGHPDEY